MNKMFLKTAARTATVLILAISVMLAPLTAQVAHATTPGSLYSYDFTGPVTANTLPNGAASNTTTKLNLYGNWVKSDFGVHFMGDQISKQAVAYTKAASGYTMNIPSSQAFGGAVMFKYEKPTDGSGCQGDSRNITQIGRFGEGLSQIKIQYSNCGTSTTHVYPECRMAGTLTTGDGTIRSSQALLDGNTYIIKCAKAPDPVTGTATLNLKVVRVDAVNGNTVTDENFQIARTGALQSTAYLSVANKYNLPTIAENTDQFNGDVAKVAYCGGVTLADAQVCLNTEVPEPTTTPVPPVDPPTPPAIHEFVGNQSLETDLTGWMGIQTATSLNTRVAGGYDGGYSIRSVNNSSAVAQNGFIDKNWWIDGTTPNKATVAGKVYTGSTWVKADTVGQKLSIYLRERNAAGVTVNSKTVTVKATSTNWFKITNDYTASQTGNSLAFYVYLADAQPHAGFNADLLSLTALN